MQAAVLLRKERKMTMDRVSVIEELYYGNIQPYAKQFDRNSEFGRLMVAMCKREEDLLKALEINPELKTSFEKYVSISGEIVAKTAEERFVDVFKLGAKFIMDIIDTGTGDLKDITD